VSFNFDVINVIIAFVWPPLLAVISVKVFPDFVSRLALNLVEHRQRQELERLKSELSRETLVNIETVKAALQADYSTLKSSVEVVSANHAGLRSEMIAACRPLWKLLIQMRTKFGDIVTFDSILTEQEKIDAVSLGGKWFHYIERYKQESILIDEAEVFASVESEEARLFIGDRLWLIFCVTRNFYLRLADLAFQSHKIKYYKDWRSDSHTISLLKTVLPDDFVNKARTPDLQGVQMIFGKLESDFLHEAYQVMSGSKAFADSLSDMHATLRLQNQQVAERSQRS